MPKVVKGELNQQPPPPQSARIALGETEYRVSQTLVSVLIVILEGKELKGKLFNDYNET